jgi:hypothetical protein
MFTLRINQKTLSNNQLMRRINIKPAFLAFSLFLLSNCGGNSRDEQSSNNQVTTAATNVDVCRCLTEPGNSEWSMANSDACRDAISRELGVENWEKVNFSQDPDLSRKFDALAEKCTGTSQVNTGIEAVDNNSEIVKEIGTTYGYIWESINNEAQLYTTLAFDGLVFRTTAYSMNGKTNSEDFIKMVDLSGEWNAIDAKSAEGTIKQNDVKVSWNFSDDYSELTNNKGVVFRRVKVK